MTQEATEGTLADQSLALAHHAFVFQSAKALGLGLFFWCGFLAFVIEEFFRPTYGLWMLTPALLMMGLSARAIRRALAAKTSVDTATAGYGQTARAFVVLLGLWWVMELGAVWGLYHEAWAFTFRVPLFALALLAAVPLALRGARAAGHDGAPRWVLRLLPQSLLLGAVAFQGVTLLRHIPAARHFRLPEVVAGLLVVNVALWFATYASARSSARRQPLPALSGAAAQRFWGWGLGVGHLVPVLMVTQGLTQLAALALGLAALGVCLCERVALQQQALATASQAQTAAESMTDTMTSRRERE